MATIPFSLRIFVADGDPDGLRIVDKSNWIGKALVFPRALLPQVPAVAEAVPGYESENWYGIAAPTGTPDDIIRFLHWRIQAVMSDDANRKRFDEAGLHPATMSLADYGAFLRTDSERWAQVVRTGNIRIND